jgi:Family of unknown function (DUF6370)
VRLAGAVAAQLPTEALMMRIARLFAAGLALLVIGGLTLAQEKEKVVDGKIACAKCELMKQAKCATTVTVKEAGKDVVYYFDDDTNKKFPHSKYCKGTKEAKVTITKTEEKDGKKYATITKIEEK